MSDSVKEILEKEDQLDTAKDNSAKAAQVKTAKCLIELGIRTDPGNVITHINVALGGLPAEEQKKIAERLVQVLEERQVKLEAKV